MGSIREATIVTKGNRKKVLVYFILGCCCLMLFALTAFAFPQVLSVGVFLGVLAGGFFLLTVYELQTRIGETRKPVAPKARIHSYTTKTVSDRAIILGGQKARITEKLHSYDVEKITDPHEKVTLENSPSPIESEPVEEDSVVELVQTDKRRAVILTQTQENHIVELPPVETSSAVDLQPDTGALALQVYCAKCRQKTGMLNPQKITMKNGRPAMQGTCSDCGTKTFRIGKAEK
jgi:hypothetical protein